MGYTYKISAFETGAERTIGTIPAEKALWWLENENDDFSEYFFHEQKSHDSEDGWSHIPEKYQLGDGCWHEDYADIFHGDHCEYRDDHWIEVYPVSENAEWEEVNNLEIKFQDLKSINTNCEDNIDPKLHNKIHQKKSLYLVYSQRVFEGNWDFYEFTINEKFVANKLTVLTKTWGSEKIVTGFEFMGQKIKPEYSEGSHLGNGAWIDS